MGGGVGGHGGRARHVLALACGAARWRRAAPARPHTVMTPVPVGNLGAQLDCRAQ